MRSEPGNSVRMPLDSCKLHELGGFVKTLCDPLADFVASAQIVLRIRIPELNEQRRKELVKVANKYAEDARIAVRHVRRDGIDIIKKALKDKSISEDDEKRFETDVQKVTDKAVAEIDQTLGLKEKEIMQV